MPQLDENGNPVVVDGQGEGQENEEQGAEQLIENAEDESQSAGEGDNTPEPKNNEPVGDDGVPLKNRLAEANRKLAERDAELSALKTQRESSSVEGQDPDVIYNKMAKQFNLTPEATKAVVEVTRMVVGVERKKDLEIMANNNIASEKKLLRDNEYYKKYKAEVDEHLRTLDPALKVQEGIVEKVLTFVANKDFSIWAKPKKSVSTPDITNVNLSSARNGDGKSLSGRLTAAEHAEWVEARGLDPKDALVVVMAKRKKDKEREDK